MARIGKNSKKRCKGGLKVRSKIDILVALSVLRTRKNTNLVDNQNKIMFRNDLNNFPFGLHIARKYR